MELFKNIKKIGWHYPKINNQLFHGGAKMDMSEPILTFPTGMLAWWDCEEVALDTNNKIIRFMDKCGNGYDFYQGNSAYRFQKYDNIIKNKAIARGGTNLYYDNTLSWGIGQKLNILLVFKVNSIGQFIHHSHASQGWTRLEGGTTQYLTIIGDVAGGIYLGGYTSAICPINKYYLINWQFDGTQDTNATKLRCFINNNEQSLTFFKAGTTTTSAVYGNLRLGKTASSSFQGDFVEGFVTNNIMTYTERLNCYNYFIQKYAL